MAGEVAPLAGADGLGLDAGAELPLELGAPLSDFAASLGAPSGVSFDRCAGALAEAPERLSVL